MDDVPITTRLTIPGKDLSFTAARSGGPGGQNVNKVSSKVDLRFNLEGTEVLTRDQKDRLRASAGGKVDSEGFLQIVVQITRDQKQNLELALEKLTEVVRACLVPPKPRKATKPSRSSVRRRLDDKRKLSDKKRSRSDLG